MRVTIATACRCCDGSTAGCAGPGCDGGEVEVEVDVSPFRPAIRRLDPNDSCDIEGGEVEDAERVCDGVAVALTAAEEERAREAAAWVED